MESGKKIRSITMSNGDIRCGDENTYLETLNEYHGEYDIDWIIMKERDGSITGKELERYNCKFIAEIIW